MMMIVETHEVSRLDELREIFAVAVRTERIAQRACRKCEEDFRAAQASKAAAVEARVAAGNAYLEALRENATRGMA